MFAKSPVIRKIMRNLLPPISFSKMLPNKTNPNKLKIRCSASPCRKIAVKNLQICKGSSWLSKNSSVKLGIRS